MKVFLASFNRASEGAISHLRQELDKRNLMTLNPIKATHIIAVGDRSETFDFTLTQFRRNKPIIHLWAGEISQGTHDEVYRHSMTLMSQMQLCTNDEAKQRVINLCKSVDKEPNAHTIGNVMLDDLTIDDELVPLIDYIVVLYNPTTLYSREEVQNEIEFINQKIKTIKKEKDIRNVIWIEPNGDTYSKIVESHVTHKNVPRPKFLGLLKHCSYFITNSSCQYYEAPFVMKEGEVIPIGERNTNRESKYADMTKEGATERIVKLLEEL